MKVDWLKLLFFVKQKHNRGIPLFPCLLSFLLCAGCGNRLSSQEGSFFNRVVTIAQNNDSQAIASNISQTSLLELVEEGKKQRREKKFKASLKTLELALLISQRNEEYYNQFFILREVGITHDESKQHDKAIETYHQALDIARDLSNPSLKSGILHEIGLSYKLLGEYDLALEYYRRSLSIFQSMNSAPGSVVTMNNIGQVYLSQEKYLQAAKIFDRALKLAKQASDYPGEQIVKQSIKELEIAQEQAAINRNDLLARLKLYVLL